MGVCATRPSVPSSAECERTCLPLQKHSRTGSGRRIESWAWANYQDRDLQGEQGEQDVDVRQDDNHIQRDEAAGWYWLYSTLHRLSTPRKWRWAGPGLVGPARSKGSRMA